MRAFVYTPKTAFVCLFATATSLPAAAHAYVGPGAGLTAIGTMIALVAAVVLALVGFVWYPMKRMMRNRSAASKAGTASQERGK
ncbi:hypothetical protein [Allosediminivita pacifica]|uniref:Uncharacterized protein n=1 Tax=Allosediminivita pacifica TaxID=1267769 RepID=A0A2T6APU4_9RHOB|nr:hypothetical protein [Allosediminivita pacifica]PTX45849.1 hypothetical protein C8N44_1197 [Allosediminivita pacifica]GGB19702.1 hypothetical protein GCM10011324_32260 [Allosediminivita pacifica]